MPTDPQETCVQYLHREQTYNGQMVIVRSSKVLALTRRVLGFTNCRSLQVARCQTWIRCIGDAGRRDCIRSVLVLLFGVDRLPNLQVPHHVLRLS